MLLEAPVYFKRNMDIEEALDELVSLLVKKLFLPGLLDELNMQDPRRNDR